ncbi:ABC transporter permease [Ruegeria arenilitoris]|uniref:ABC transporter permease n=1 Tax=Ruegeria arenilitoris TaxID=1173585 RepID=UPI00147D4712|nr:FtsX-like permease family protein [Ruegeria arenilitoris]
MSALTTKLVRDLWRIRGQAVAIGLVIALGVLMQVMQSGLVVSLDETRRAYYERYRLADIFAPVTRAPEHTAQELRNLPGVSAVETRVVGQALVDLPELDIPIRAQAISLPDIKKARLNLIYLTDGRSFATNRQDEIIVLQSFAQAHGLQPGDRISATMNGARRDFDIVGLAMSPEFLFAAPPGEMIPDDSRFAVLWLSRPAMEAAYNLNGAFNEALISLSREADTPAILRAADQLLNKFGGLGAFPLEDLASDKFVSEEIDGLRRTSATVPPIFLAVAAFLLYIVISRLLDSEREEIGLMKAFGYTDWEVGSHYLKMILTIAGGGAFLGGILGIIAGRALIDVYLIYYKFPFLVFRLEPLSFVVGFGASILASSVGGLVVLLRVFALTPAVAMRAAPPPDYSRSGQIGKSLAAYLDQPTRMVLRRLTRQPIRMIGAIAGVSAGIALSASMASILASFDKMTDLTFDILDRSDVSVSFINPISSQSLFDIQSIDGVIETEPVRIVPVIFRNGRLSYRGAVNGLTEFPRLNRAVDAAERMIPMRKDGVILSSGLAKILDLHPGELLTVDVREGRRPILQLPVVAVSESLMGSPAYMELAALNRVLGEPGRVSGAFLRTDEKLQGWTYKQLKEMPMVAGVSLKSESRGAFQKVVDQGAGAMRYIMALIAGVITFGVIYNAARVAQAERTRDLAALRVLGFTRAEVAFVLLGELVVVTLLALPLGALAGYGLTFAVSQGFSTDLYQIPSHFNVRSFGQATVVVIVAALLSGWLVKRNVDRLDLVLALKSRE